MSVLEPSAIEACANGVEFVDEAPTLVSGNWLNSTLCRHSKGGKGFAVVYRHQEGSRTYTENAPTLRSLTNTNGHQAGSGAVKVRVIDGCSYIERPMSAREYENCMGWEPNSTATGITERGREIQISETQRKRVLGNGIIPQEITEILTELKPFLAKEKTAASAVLSNTKEGYTMIATFFGGTDSEILEAIGSRIEKDLDAFKGNAKKKNSWKQASSEWHNWKKFKAIADAGTLLTGMYVAKITDSTMNAIILGTLQELGRSNCLVTWEDKGFCEPEQLGNLIPANLDPKNGFTPRDRVSFGDNPIGIPSDRTNTGTVTFFADGEPVVFFDSGHQVVVGFQTLKKENATPDKSESIFSTLKKDWKSDMAIASELEIPLTLVRTQLEALEKEKKVRASSTRNEWQLIPEEPSQPIPQNTEITLNTDSGSATQKEITQDNIGSATESDSKAGARTRATEDSVQPGNDAGKLEALQVRVYALLKPEKRSLRTIAEEVGEDLAEVAIALHKLNRVGRALQIEGSFWSLPDLIREISPESATKVVWEYLEQFQTGRERCEAVALTHDTVTSEHVHAAAALFPENEREVSLRSIRKVFLNLYYSDDVQDFLEGLPQFKTGSKVRWIKDKVENSIAKVVEVSGCAIKTDASPMFFLSSCFELATEGETRQMWKVGSRVESQMSGAVGELTRNLKTKVSIWWDKDKDMGLKPKDYTEEEMDVMRIGLLPTPTNQVVQSPSLSVSEELEETCPETNRYGWNVGSRLTDNRGIAVVAEVTDKGVRLDWIGLGFVPVPPLGKGVWYDWEKERYSLDKLEPYTWFLVGDRVEHKIYHPNSRPQGTVTAIEFLECRLVDQITVDFGEGEVATITAEYLSLVEADPSSAICVEQPNSSGDEQPLTEWQAYGYTWTFDPASKIIQCEKLWWELEKFSLCFDDFTGNGDSTQIDPNQSPQSWLDDWMVAYRDRFSNVLFSNNKLATEGESQVREQEAESRRQFKAGDRVSTSFGEGTILAINNTMASIAWDDDSQTYKPGALIEAKHLKLVRERDDDIDPIQEANSTTADTRVSPTPYPLSSLKLRPTPPSILWLNPDDIIIDAGTQSRLKEDEERIDDYKRDMDLGEWDYERRPLPKVAINEDGRYYAIDCHHRVKAGRKSIECDRMLFEVHQATLAQTRLWSASANTQHGLCADNSPYGVRKRIEMFLDNIEFLTPEQYQSEFEKIPDLTPTERKTGKFSDRTIARYLRLRPNQYKTVQNIRREREFAGKFSQMGLEEGVSRVEVVADHPDRPIGAMGLVMQLDRKSGVWVKWDANGQVWAIHPDLITKTDSPKPITVVERATNTPTVKPTRTVKSLVESAAQSFGLPVQGDSLLPDVTPETPDQGSPVVVTPYQEQTSTTPAEYAKAEAFLAVQDTACAMSRLSPLQWGEVLEIVAQMGVSDRHFQEAIKAAEGVLVSRAFLPQVG